MYREWRAVRRRRVIFHRVLPWIFLIMAFCNGLWDGFLVCAVFGLLSLSLRRGNRISLETIFLGGNPIISKVGKEIHYDGFVWSNAIVLIEAESDEHAEAIFEMLLMLFKYEGIAEEINEREEYFFIG